MKKVTKKKAKPAAAPSPIATRLAAARVAAGLTQEQAAAAVDSEKPFRQSLWSLYEKGKRTPSLAMLARLAAAVGTTPAKLLED